MCIMTTKAAGLMTLGHWKSSHMSLMVEPPHSRRRSWNLKENDHKNIRQTSQLLRNKHIIK